MSKPMKLETEKPAELRTNTQFVQHVENMLGFVLPGGKPAWKARTIEAAKLKRKRAQNPKLYSMENLALTVEWMRQHKVEAKSPAGVCWFVEDALANVRSDSQVGDLAGQLNEAIAEAAATGESEWLTRLSRAQGDEARREVLAAWNQRG